jgi:hypothetical protein
MGASVIAEVQTRLSIMNIRVVGWLHCCCLAAFTALDSTAAGLGGLLPGSPPGISLWWAPSSAAKIRPDQAAPAEPNPVVGLRAARNEREAVQLVVHCARALEDFTITGAALAGPGGARLGADPLEVLRAGYVQIDHPTDAAARKGLWPDPLLPVTGPLTLAPDCNHAFWLRVFVPPETPAGSYAGKIALRARNFEISVPLELTVHDFTLPDRMTCTTAFGFSPELVFRYQRLRDERDKRLVLEKYWANFAAHHISPYDPAPLDPIQLNWPALKPPRTVWDDWSGLRFVANEKHGGDSALLILDEKADENVTATYQPLIRIPAGGLRLRFWSRTAVPDHRFLITLTHHDANQQWLSGKNNDLTVSGSGLWQEFNETITRFPAGAEFVRFQARATRWTEAGDNLGLVWLDDLSLTAAATGVELLPGGDFERRPRTAPVVPPDQLKAEYDFTAWDRAMTRAIDHHHFNSFRVAIPGLGGGTFHEIQPPQLLGFGADTPEYPLLFDSAARQLEAHLVAKGWADEAYIYWFDEPDPHQYPFVMDGFAKLKRSCPGLARMLTEQVEPGLLGGPDIWCSITDNYQHAAAEARRKHGEKFWWYVCTGPKAPYAGLFIDHPAPELRIWLWQTFQRNIEGVLVWETNYWTSSAAYPDPRHPQNPYIDPMSWTSGYSTPAGDRRPWGNGDGRFLYPPVAAAAGMDGAPVLDGPVDSIRWEHLRDGIEDYEYLVILRQRLAARRADLPAATWQRLAALLEVPAEISRSLTEFAADGGPIEAHRDQVARAIAGLR